jgi:hypothetical protein
VTPQIPQLPPEGILLTNQVYVLQTFGPVVSGGVGGLLEDLRELKVNLSAAATKYLAAQGLEVSARTAPRPVVPGVVGLIHRRTDGMGFVTPLAARLANEWYVAPNLPFGAADLREALTRLLHAAGMDLADLHTEFFAFDVRDLAGFSPDGTSMTIAGLLAILVAVAGDPKGVFRAACSIVQPGEADTLSTVAQESIGIKLEAFVREYEGGSLLVRPSRCPEADEFDRYFKARWQVDSFGDLAEHAERAGLLAAFRRQTPLNRHHFERARDRLLYLAGAQHCYQRVLPLAQHLLEHPCREDVTPGSLDDVRRLVYDLQRHLGRYVEAVSSAAGELSRLCRRPERSSYDEQARAAAALASALFDAHRFAEARKALSGLYDQVTADPPVASPLARVMVFNTLGRVETLLGGDWRSRFRASLALQRATNPPECARTYCYLAHALLRHERLHEAERAISAGENCCGSNAFSRWMLAFVRADLARRQGSRSDNEDMDGQVPAPGPSGHPLGMYFQARARQKGRPPGECADLLLQAARFFEADLGGAKELNLLSFLATCVRLRAAAALEDNVTWRLLRKELRRYLRGRPNRGLARHYRHAWDALGDAPDVGAADALLALVPYF